MSEVRLIDANALMERFAEMQKVKPDKDGREYACNFLNMGGEPSAEWFAVEDAVENAPTVDAVPVEWIKAKIESLKSQDNEFASLAARTIQAMLNDYGAEGERRET